MKQCKASLLVLFSVCTLLLAGCSDPEPAEVSMNVTHGGTARSCLVQVFNAQGKQIQEESADQYGVVYVKNLAPGNYTFKFVGHDGQPYPAERSATVRAGGSEFMKVELTEAAPAGS